MFLKIILENCDPDSAYKVKVFSVYFNFGEELVGETMEEMPQNNGHLEFHVRFETKIYFERKQELRFELFKEKTNSKFTCKCSITKIIKNKKGEFVYVFSDSDNKEKMIIQSEIEYKPKKFIQLGLSLQMKNPEYKSYFCYKIQMESNENNQDMIKNSKNKLIYESENQEFLKDQKIINFSVYGATSYEICFGNLDAEIVIYVKNVSKNKALIKPIKTSINKLIENPVIEIDNEITIYINIYQKEINQLAAFFKNNLDINMCLAIDFTVSNGDPNTEVSLHYIKNKKIDNPYVKAIRKCGEIIAQYDSDNLFPCFGYCGQIPSLYDEKKFEYSQCFNLNFENDPNIKGIDQVIKIYKKAVEKVKLGSENTEFNIIIKRIIDLVHQDIMNFNKLVYNILVLMTDGKNHDTEETKKAIVDSSFYPISIIIVGIGQGPFTNMNDLFNVKNLIQDKENRRACRDNIKFIPFSEYETNLSELSLQIFEEIPKHIVEYFSVKDITPDDLNKKNFREMYKGKI